MKYSNNSVYYTFDKITIYLIIPKNKEKNKVA